jgi:hypothetical protein
MQKTATLTKSFKIQQPLYAQLLKISNARGVTFSRLVIESLEEKTVSNTQPKKDYSIYSGLISNEDAKLFDQGVKESRRITNTRKEVDFS